MFIVQPCNRVWRGFVYVSVLGWPLCTGTGAQAQSKPQPQGESDKRAEIKTLLNERQALLEKIVTQLVAQYRAGTVDYSRVAQAELDALKATLDAADGSEKRTAALQQCQKNAETFVQIAEARWKAAMCTEVDVLQAKAILLTVKIEQLRDQQHAKPPK